MCNYYMLALNCLTVKIVEERGKGILKRRRFGDEGFNKHRGMHRKRYIQI